MKLIDWRALPESTVRALLAAERRWWHTHLHWDLGPALEEVTPARRDGRLPGLAVLDGMQRPVAWAFFTGDRDLVHVGAMGATERRAGDVLAAAFVEASEQVQANVIVALIRPGVGGVADALAARGFAHEAYDYYVVDTAAFRRFAADVRLYLAADEPALADLFEQAYAEAHELRPFAPRGTAYEWAAYVRQILHTQGCGDFQPRASVVAGGSTLEGAALITAIDPETAHLAQVAVAVGARQHGLGRRLVESAVAAARARGYRRLSLFVAASNTRARGLYDRLGFRKTASFQAAVRLQPRLLTSVGAVTGASTRR